MNSKLPSLTEWVEFFPKTLGSSKKEFEQQMWAEPWMSRPLREAECEKRSFLKHIYEYKLDKKIGMMEVFCGGRTQWIKYDSAEYTSEIFLENPMVCLKTSSRV